jgi:hypothetical protein
MYIADTFESLVYLFTYPSGKLVGTIGGLSEPGGMCADAKGDVWISNFTANEIQEYKHAGTQPIATLQLANQAVIGCSVDPTTGALAVDSFCHLLQTNCNSDGSVFIYSDIRKQPQQYGVLNAENVYFCGYDAKGDLFVDAYAGPTGPFLLGELPKGGSTVQSVSLNRPIYYPGGVQWDGKYLAVGDQEAGNEITSSVHQIEVKGSNGTIVGTTKLLGTGDVLQFWIQGKTIVTPNIGIGQPNDARVFTYPAGGKPTTIFGTHSFQSPEGAVVSLAAK